MRLEAGDRYTSRRVYVSVVTVKTGESDRQRGGVQGLMAARATVQLEVLRSALQDCL
jgi:hypothetical protein